jgi:hypothetical protein
MARSDEAPDDAVVSPEVTKVHNRRSRNCAAYGMHAAHASEEGENGSMPKVGVNDIELHYEKTGSGFPVILCHEFAGDLRSWEPQVRHFARRYRVITYNYRGYAPWTCRPIRRPTARKS